MRFFLIGKLCWYRTASGQNSQMSSEKAHYLAFPAQPQPQTAMSNALQRTAMLRAAHEANQTAMKLQRPDTPRSYDPRATATTGYQAPSACWAPRHPIAPTVPMTPVLNRRRMPVVAQVPNMATVQHHSAPFDWGKRMMAHYKTDRIGATTGYQHPPDTMLESVPDVDHACNSSSDDSGHSDEEICWKPCCSA